MNTMQKILEFISTEFLRDSEAAELNGETDLLETSILDSLGVMRLVGFLETEFDISVPPEDVTIEHFQSINVIAEYIERRRS